MHQDIKRTRLRRASDILGRTYMLFLVISLSQHIRGTLQASSDPVLQEQAFFTSNSSPQVLQ
jgi:hypothetical protein